MALPPSLIAHTSPIVDKALETGARGTTVTKTDYGVIGDAMFKKAQLDMNIANLQMDFGLRTAQMKGDLALGTATLGVDAAYKKQSLSLEREKFDYQKQMDNESNDVSAGEKLMGMATGALSGAAAGAAFSPAGMVAGGVAGAGMAYMGAKNGGAKGMAQANQFTAAAASAIPTIKSMNDARVYKDSLSSLNTKASSAQAVLNNPNVDDNFKETARKELYGIRDEMTSASIKAGINPQQAYEGGNAFIDYSTKGTSMDSDPKVAGQRKLAELGTKIVAAEQSGMSTAQKADFLKTMLPQFNAAYAQAHTGEKFSAAAAGATFQSGMGPNLMGTYKTLSQNGGQLPQGTNVQTLPQGGGNQRPVTNPGSRPIDGGNAAPPPEAVQMMTRGAPEQLQQQNYPMSRVPSSIQTQSGAQKVQQAIQSQPTNYVMSRPAAASQGPGIEYDVPIASESRVAQQGAAASQVINRGGAQGVSGGDFQATGASNRVAQVNPNQGQGAQMQQAPSASPFSGGGEIEALTPREQKLLSKAEPGMRGPGELLMDAVTIDDEAQERNQSIRQDNKLKTLLKDPEFATAYQKREALKVQERVSQRAKTFKSEPEAIYKTSEDPGEIARALGADKVAPETMSEAEDLETAVTLPAELNTIRNKWDKANVNILSKMTPQQKQDFGKMAELYKSGEGGENKDLVSRAKAIGVQVPGTMGGGASASYMERNFSQQLEKAGVLPKNITQDEMDELDALLMETDQVSVALASNAMTGVLTDKDLAKFMFRNVGHMNSGAVTKKIDSVQDSAFKKSRFKIEAMTQKQSYKRQEAEMKQQDKVDMYQMQRKGRMQDHIMKKQMDSADEVYDPFGQQQLAPGLNIY